MLVRLLLIMYPRFSTFLPIQGTSSRTIFQRQGQGGQIEGQGQKMGSMRGVQRPLVLLSCSHVFHKQCVLHFEDFLVDSDVSQSHLCFNCTFCMDKLYHYEFFLFTNVATPSFIRILFSVSNKSNLRIEQSHPFSLLTFILILIHSS
jgi:hypothetical protein